MACKKNKHLKDVSCRDFTPQTTTQGLRTNTECAKCEHEGQCKNDMMTLLQGAYDAL